MNFFKTERFPGKGFYFDRRYFFMMQIGSLLLLLLVIFMGMITRKWPFWPAGVHRKGWT